VLRSVGMSAAEIEEMLRSGAAAEPEAGPVTGALRSRAVGALFRLLRQYTGASQTQIGIACGMSQGKVSQIMGDRTQVESLAVLERIADGLELPDPARMRLGLAPRPGPAEDTPPGWAADPPPRAAADASWDAAVPGTQVTRGALAWQEEDDPVLRRTFVSLAGASLVSALLSDSPSGSRLLNAATAAPEPDIAALGAAVGGARREYQACRYAGLFRRLPTLLGQLDAACQELGGDEQLRSLALAADAYHVTAGLLLKLDDRGLAQLAADRSMRAARASQDPVAIAASARIVVHALLTGGYLPAAVSTATHHAAQLDRDLPRHDAGSLSVYGLLLLRGAIAAAQNGQKSTAGELLSEASRAAEHVGSDANLRGMAFGPANVRLHEVSVAVAFGDAGTAIETAQSINPAAFAVTERKAALLIDTARAYFQWGKYEDAYRDLRAADQVAHEEITTRPGTRRLAGDLAALAPPSIRRDARDFAVRVGALR
jgi:transcriptional regulator with XRE-family HTH domain